MRLELDQEADAPYLGSDESAIIEFDEVQPAMILDPNAENRAVGAEFQAADQEFQRWVLEDG